MEITHFSHRHSLALSDQMNDGTCCSGCMLPITGPGYVCANCKYYLHKSCGELPQQIDHPFHPIHPLTLAKAPYRSGEFCCNACQDICTSFVFCCSQCSFNLDIVCASLKPTPHVENHEQQINHFSHQHPLIPFTCNEKKHKIKCSGCDQPIKGLIFVCFGCKFFIHKSCAELPRQIRHPFHPRHDLSLLTKEQYYQCHACNKASSGLTYYCSECNFDLDIICSRFKSPTTHEGNHQEQQIEHFYHKHPLTPVSCVEEDVYKIACSVCSMDVQNTDGSIYVCFDCKIFIHKSCFELPSEIQSFPFHPKHTLILCPRQNLEGRECSLCQEPRFGLLVFQCTSCDYVIDVACAMHMPSIGMELWERRIEHHCHKEHPLVPFDWKNELYICSGCEGLKEGSGYTCPQCYYFICQSCAKLQEQVEHPFHPQHKLLVWPKNPFGDTYCKACGEHHSRSCFLLHCFECSFHIALKCASLPTVKYEGHEHPLAFMDLEANSYMQYNRLECHTCHDLCRSSFLRCVMCDLNLHVNCIPPLPRTVKVRSHKHRLTITDPLPCSDYDDSDQYYCYACEKPRNPKHSVYYCAQCEIAAHIECGLSEVVMSSAEDDSLVFQQLVDAGVNVFRCCPLKEKKQNEGCGAGAGIKLEDLLHSVALEEKNPDQGGCSGSGPIAEIEVQEKNLDVAATGIKAPQENLVRPLPIQDPSSNMVKVVMEKIKEFQRARARQEAHNRISAHPETLGRGQIEPGRQASLGV